MTTAELIKIAEVIYAEGGIFSGKNYNALLAIAQCIHDLLPSYKDLDTLSDDICIYITIGSVRSAVPSGGTSCF